MRGRWWVLALLSVTIAGNYYAFDSIAPVADLLRHQRAFSQSQLGLLNAVFDAPNIPLSLVGGVLIDRIGAARASLLAAAFCFVGAVLTAIGEPFSLMVFGRLLFGVGEETLFISLLAGVAQWFSAGGGGALAMALFFSMARVGSYGADISPRWAASVYAGGWRPPLELAAALTAISLIAAIAYLRIDRYRPVVAAAPSADHGQFRWRDLTSFDRSFWYILALNVLFASVFFPFRSTFAIVFFQDAKQLSLAQAGLVNSWVFFAAIFATPVFGLIADRFGQRADVADVWRRVDAPDLRHPGPHPLEPVDFHRDDGLKLFGYPGGDLAVDRHAGGARPAGHGLWSDQCAAEPRHGGPEHGRGLAERSQPRRAA